jgi:hypothetical protein
MIMKVGISGHQSRPGIDWQWTASQVAEAFENWSVERILTSLAIGSDQVCAQQAFELDIAVTAVLPLSNYEQFFKSGDLPQYRDLLGKCEIVTLADIADTQEAFFNAGKYIVDQATFLIAIWDGKPAVGLGGTADVVQYCLDKKKAVLHINPIEFTVKIIGSISKKNKAE